MTLDALVFENVEFDLQGLIFYFNLEKEQEYQHEGPILLFK